MSIFLLGNNNLKPGTTFITNVFVSFSYFSVFHLFQFQNTSINLPDPTTMNVVGFEVPKENQFWAQDYIEGDTNYGKRPEAAPAVSPQTRYRILLNNLESNLVKTKIPSGTYTEYICAALGYCFAPDYSTKRVFLAGEEVQ